MDAHLDRPRRILRANRVLAALGSQIPLTQEAREREKLAIELIRAVATESRVLSEAAYLDASVSIALSPVQLSVHDTLSSLALAGTVLAKTGQFARLHGLANLLRREVPILKDRQPFLALTLEALSEIWRGRKEAALLALNIGLNPQVDVIRVPRDTTQLAQALLASSLREWLRTRSTSYLEYAKGIALEAGDGLLMTVAESAEAVASAFDNANAKERVSRSLMGPQVPWFDRYLDSLARMTLFPAQLHALEAGVLEPGSKVIAMPTSSGKTLISELKILAELGRNVGSRAVYLAPYRLLANQVEMDLRSRLPFANIKVQDLGGNYDVYIDEELKEQLPDIAVMTPERFDAVLRLSDSSRPGSDTASELIDSMRTVILDEAQILGRDGRGPKIELLLTRLKQRIPSITIVALAPVAHSVDGLAQWINGDAIVFSLGRPTGLIEVVWKSDGKLLQNFEGHSFVIGERQQQSSPYESAADLVRGLGESKAPILIVEPRRDYAEGAIAAVANSSSLFGNRWYEQLRPFQRDLVDEAASLASAIMGENSQLVNLIRSGLAFHHAGVPSLLLRKIEELTLRGCIRVLAATTTVAEGAHLPFQILIIPHLNFAGGLTREFYNNLIGRAGRAMVAVEGIVFILESEPMKGTVERRLWRETDSVQLEGSLNKLTNSPNDLDSYRTQREVDGQILAWLGENGSYVERQAEKLASSTFTWLSSDDLQKTSLIYNFEDSMSRLEQLGVARTESPYALTEFGKRVRLAGIGPQSCRRLVRILETQADTLVARLSDIDVLDDETASLISHLVFQAEETLESSLWLKTQRWKSKSAASEFARLADGITEWPSTTAALDDDIRMLAGWIMGLSYNQLAEAAPIFDRKTKLPFATTDTVERAEDAVNILNRLTYPASWVWGAIRALLGERGERLPSWIREAIEYGVPSETSTELVKQVPMSRAGSIIVSDNTSPRWQNAFVLFHSDDRLEQMVGRLNTADAAAINRFISSSID